VSALPHPRFRPVQNAAMLFGPLRVVHDEGSQSFDVCTREDLRPGSLANFALARCQFAPEARLFAAAPELLAALKGVCARWHQSNSPEILAARAAIAKAEGLA